MKTLLLPVDFTATSDNAINFAAEWSRQYQYDRIILLKTFYESMFENMAMSAEYSHVNQDYLNVQREQGRGRLQGLCRSLAAKAGRHVKVTTATSEIPLLRAIKEVVETEKPELIIVGSDNYNASSHSLIAENLIAIARVSTTRVLIVPADYAYTPVRKALVPTDFNTIRTLEKLNNLRSTVQWNDLQLLVLNVNTNENTSRNDEAVAKTESYLHEYLKNFQHSIHYATDRNVIRGIINFSAENDVQLIISLPGKHSFLYSLTHESISEAIYRNARQPVMILK